jgi:hypothetical protein
LPANDEFSRVLFLAVDAWRYGSRDDRQQHDLQRSLAVALSAAAERSELDRSGWYVQDGGDGLLALIPDGGSEPKLVDPFVRELDTWLARHNHDLLPAARLRLRVAVHHGMGAQADLGISGNGPVHVCRLRDAGSVRAALDALPAANLVLAISQPIFEDLVCQRHTSLSADDFVRVEVAEPKKDFRAAAWLRVPGVPAERLAAVIATGPEVLALAIRCAVPMRTCPGFFDRVLKRSFESARMPLPEDVSAGDEFLIQLPPGTPGELVLGIWLHHLHKALQDHAPLMRLAVGVALARGKDAACRQATELARSDAAAGRLAATTRGRLVVVVSEHVHEAIVAKGGNLVRPESYRPTGSGAAWVRVPGHSIPPDPAETPPAAPAEEERTETATVNVGAVHSVVTGPAIGHATFNEPFVIGTWNQHTGPGQ